MSKKKIYLDDIINTKKNYSYLQIHEYIVENIKNKKFMPIKNSGINGKKPALYNAYWMIDEDKDYSNLLDELNYKIHPSIDISYFLKNPDKYEKVRDNILMLSDYLYSESSKCGTYVTLNERSFDIFHKEKYIDLKGGKGLLNKLNICKKDLKYYNTWEPMSYYTASKKTPQVFLIIENKDTFFSMRKHLIENSQSNDIANTIYGIDVGTLIYGAGKSIHKTFLDFVNNVEPYFAKPDNEVLYFGDIDYEGIIIYEGLANKYKDRVKVKPCVKLYTLMLSKAKKIGFDNLPIIKEEQNKNISDVFLNYFETESKCAIMNILKKKRYIPQEIINESDY